MFIFPKKIRKNKLAPKSEQMTYLGNAEGGIGFRFMRSPNNVVFTSSHALFDEKYFPHCKTSKRTIRQPDDAPNNRQPDPESDQPPFMEDDDDFHPFLLIIKGEWVMEIGNFHWLHLQRLFLASCHLQWNNKNLSRMSPFRLSRLLRKNKSRNLCLDVLSVKIKEFRLNDLGTSLVKHGSQQIFS